MGYYKGKPSTLLISLHKMLDPRVVRALAVGDCSESLVLSPSICQIILSEKVTPFINIFLLSIQTLRIATFYFIFLSHFICRNKNIRSLSGAYYQPKETYSCILSFHKNTDTMYLTFTVNSHFWSDLGPKIEGVFVTARPSLLEIHNGKVWSHESGPSVVLSSDRFLHNLMQNSNSDYLYGISILPPQSYLQCHLWLVNSTQMCPPHKLIARTPKASNSLK